MKKRSHLLVTLPVFLVFGSIFVFLLLPYLSDRYLLPQLIKELPFTERELSISRITPWQIRGTVTFADRDKHTLSIPRFELHYTPGDLLRGKISRLLIDSASLHVVMLNGQPVIQGLTVGSASTEQKEKTPKLLLPLAVETIVVKNSTLVFHRSEDESFTFIADGRFSSDFVEQTENRKLLSGLTGEILLRGDIALSGKFEAKALDDGHEVSWQMLAPNIGQLAKFFTQLRELQPTGELSLNGKAKIEKLSRIASYEATAKLSQFRFAKNSFILENKSVEKPVILFLEGDLEKTRYNLTNVVLAGPEKASLDLEGELGIFKGEISGIGHIFFERTQSQVTINFNGYNNESGNKVNFQLKSDAFILADSLSLSSFSIDGMAGFKNSILSGYLDGQIPKVFHGSSETALVDLSFQMPFQFPHPDDKSIVPGEFTIAEIHHQDVNSGNLQASLSQSPEGIDFITSFTTSFDPHLKLTCNGTAKVTSNVSLRCRMPETLVDSSSLPSYIHLPEGLSFGGKLALEGDFHLQDKKPEGSLTVEWHDGTLTHGENNLSDINCSVDFPNIPRIQSGPGQLCTIGSLDLGKIKMSDGRIRFRVEDEQTIFLEKTKLSWCGGRVEAGSVRLTRTFEELETTLYCDRLSFTELLGQFSIEGTEGQGTLNGRLPVLLNSQGVEFDDGFLFSTPGNSGIVRFNNTKQLRQGMPDVAQTAYLDYSMKALENFSYNWTKLSFNSQGEDLLIKMQLDGKPAEPLPFGYKSGHIVPSDKGPGLQHPIRLDVNFRLPLQDLFQYGKNIQSIMEKM